MVLYLCVCGGSCSIFHHSLGTMTICTYLTQRVTLIQVKSSLHEDTRLVLHIPEHQTSLMTGNCEDSRYMNRTAAGFLWTF